MPAPDKVYIDACCFIDMAKSDKKVLFDADRSDNVWFCKRILEAARDDAIKVYTSSLTLVECIGVRINTKEQIKSDDDTKRLFKGMLGSGKSGVIPVQPHNFIIEAARDLAWKHGIFMKPIDSVHIATASDMKCGEFLTTDARIKSANRKSIYQVLQLSVIEPRKTKLLPEKYRQMSLPEE